MKWTVATGLLLTIVGVCLLFASPSQAQALTTVNISPSTQTVNASQTFTVGVYIVPGEPISSAQCDLTFNATLLQANSVTQGNLLYQGCSATSGYIEINNSIGKITGIWGSTMAFCTVSNPGTFVNISFTAKNVSGTSFLNLSKVIVGDVNTSPVSISMTNGSATVAAPGITFTPTPASTATATPTAVSTATPTPTTTPSVSAGNGTPFSTPTPSTSPPPTTAQPTPTLTPSPTTSHTKGGGTNWALVGGIIGGVFLLAVTVIVVNKRL